MLGAKNYKGRGKEINKKIATLTKQAEKKTNKNALMQH